MTREEITAKVEKIIRRECRLPASLAVLPDASLYEVFSAKPLDVLQVVFELEEEFDIEIPDEDAEEIKTVRDCTQAVCCKLGIG